MKHYSPLPNNNQRRASTSLHLYDREDRSSSTLPGNAAALLSQYDQVFACSSEEENDNLCYLPAISVSDNSSSSVSSVLSSTTSEDRSRDGDVTPPLDTEYSSAAAAAAAVATPKIHLPKELMLASTYSTTTTTSSNTTQSTGTKRKRTAEESTHSPSKHFKNNTATTTESTSLDRLMQLSQEHFRNAEVRPRLPSVSEFLSHEDWMVGFR